MELIPVDHDPFASPPATRITVRPNEAKTAPVDHDPFRKMGAPEDMARSLLSGIASGAISLAGLPSELAEYGAQGIDLATRYIGEKLGVPVEARTPVEKPTLGVEHLKQLAKDVGVPFHKPQSTPGEYAHTVGEFAPGALIGPGGVAARAAQVVIPAVTSETAGQLVKDTPGEPVARLAGAVAGGIGTAIAVRPGATAQAIRGQLPEGITPAMMDDAARLMDNAAQQGVTLAWPEALSQVAGRPVMTNLLRHLEASPQTERRMAEFFGQRPVQVENAGRAAFDVIEPPIQAPATVGPQAGRIAEQVIADAKGVLNTHTRPLYDAARTQRIDPALFARVQNDPVFQEGLRRVRNDPFIGPTLQGHADDSVAVIDAIKKQLDETGRNLRDPMSGTARNNYAAALVDQGNQRMVRAADVSTGSDPTRGLMGSYETARTIQSDVRRRFIEPLMQGPLGKMAGRDTTTRKAIDALFPQSPLPGSADEIATAVGALAHRSPRVAGQLVRAHAESVFDEATQAIQTSGANQAGGAKFAARLVGNPQQRANFEAAVTALPNGADRLAGFNRFLEVMEAMRYRQNIGSRTAYNQQLFDTASPGGLMRDASKVATDPMHGLKPLMEKYENWQLGRNLNELAAILTDPAALGLLRGIARLPVESRRGQQLALRLATMELASRN